MGKPKLKQIYKKDGKTPVQWNLSLTRDMLEIDIQDKKIGPSTALKDAHKSRPEYLLYDEDKFEEYLESMLKLFKTKESNAARDDAAVKQFRKIHPKPTTNARGDEPRWEGSKAEDCLKTDMENLKHTKMKPQKLRETNKEYEKFGKKTFRNHIYQATRAEKFTNYVTDKSEKKKEHMKKLQEKNKKKTKKGEE